MALNAEVILRIREVVKDILVSRLEKFPSDTSNNRNAPFHDSFLNAFSEQLSVVNIPTPYLVALASWMHGLNTSLGTGFENIAHILSGGYKRTFTGADTLKVSSAQAKEIEAIIVQLKKGDRHPNLSEEDKLIAAGIKLGGSLQTSLGFTADVYIEKGNLIECIELKSVRPNSGEGRGEKQKILYAKAAFKRLYPKKDVKFYVGFPFDPTSDTPTGYNKERFMNYLIEFKKFFSPDEILIASELWDYLSGEKRTMEAVLKIVAATVKDFSKK